MYKRDDFDIVIGLEFHAQANCATKLFSPAPAPVQTNAFDTDEDESEPDKYTSLIDAGMPGSLPVVNKAAIEKGIRTALALNMKISDICCFDRKHYSYPDLPIGYQITQQFIPLASDGYIQLDTIDPATNKPRRIRFERLSLEADAAKNIHKGSYTYVDLNRCGVCLMETVTHPDIRSPEEMMLVFRKFQNILKIINTSGADMYKGELRADVNLSINLKGQPYGDRVEIKNLNSVQYAYQALEYEIARHISVINKGEKVESETRTFDPNTGATKSMRTKEQAADYRFFPEANIAPIEIDPEYVSSIKQSMPELLDDIIARWIHSGISQDKAALLAQDCERIKFLDDCLTLLHAHSVHNIKTYELCATLITQDIFGLCNTQSIDFKQMKITPTSLAALILNINQDIISGKQAKDVLKEMFETGKHADDIIKEKGLRQITNPDELSSIIHTIITANPNEFTRYRSGNKNLLGFFIGQVMLATNNRANPKLLNELLSKILNA